ncbi:MAG TPA: hypothetical protein VKR60_13070 [Candidatus Sulfotelmatobacter sp.]|nr:hypothetical protein [Candidatus Sulfotelmatobacter sp.]
MTQVIRKKLHTKTRANGSAIRRAGRQFFVRMTKDESSREAQGLETTTGIGRGNQFCSIVKRHVGQP